MQNAVARNFSDPGNIILLLIGLLTVLLMFHGKTMILVPRYRGVEVQSKESGEQWVLDDKADFEKLDSVKVYSNPKDNPEWQPPCLPNEAPDYESKQKVKENLQDSGIKVVVEAIEDEFQKVKHNLEATTTSKANS